LVSTGQGVLGNNMFAYCENNWVNNFDPGGTSLIAAALATFAAYKGAIALGGLILSAVIVSSAPSSGSGLASPSLIPSFSTKYDPDPYARPGQKKQGREVKEKKKAKDWESRNNKRSPEPPKKHTPGKDHKKYDNKLIIPPGYSYDLYTDYFYDPIGPDFTAHQPSYPTLEQEAPVIYEQPWDDTTHR